MSTHRFRASDGTSLSARVSGDGPAVLQLSGGPGGSYLPDPPAGLTALVVSPEPRSTGDSGAHGLGRAIADLEDLGASLDLEQWDLVIGHGAGADLGLVYAAERPDAVEQLVSVGGSGFHDGLARGEDGPAALLDDWRRWIQEPFLFGTLAEVSATTSIVVAELDSRPTWPLAQLASLFDEELRVLAGVGHDFWRTHPERWWDLVREAVDPPPAERDLVREAQLTRERLAILDPLTDAADDARAVLELVLTSADVETARRRLMAERGLTELAASAVLDIQIRRLPAAERERIRQARDEVRRSVADAPGT